jgi:hypothetical protein
MNAIPLPLSLFFGFTTLLTVYLFYKASRNSKITLFVLLSWLALQSFIGLSGFYTVTNTLPPRFLLLVGPPLLFIIVLFATRKGRNYIDSFDNKTLTLLHTVRVAVELTLMGLFIYKTVPQLMTFEGRNFDILSGLTAPVVYYFGFVKKKISIAGILIWNFICLALLANIVTIAILSAPFPFQQLAFDQPNIAVLYFPYIWLPCCIVPLVLFSHLIAARQLLNDRKK